MIMDRKVALALSLVMAIFVLTAATAALAMPQEPPAPGFFEGILSPQFLLDAAIYALAGLFVTAKLLDVLKATQKPVKVIISALVSFALSAGSSFYGPGIIFAFLLPLGYVGGAPMAPVEVGAAYYPAMAIFTWMVAGGIYDWRKENRRA